ncbi:RPH3L protein, partial [Calcarius ornatus]|nr:RPH3L protein [Calcarius ornatus]
LQTGWSVHTFQTEKQRKMQALSPQELELILGVIRKAEQLDVAEQQRVGRLVERLENMRRNAMGNGLSQCLLCGEMLGLLGSSSVFCQDCKKKVCTKCGIEAVGAQKRPLWLCKICSEQREVWKRSGAWFYRGLPKYIPPLKSTSSSKALELQGQPWQDEPESVGSSRSFTWARGKGSEPFPLGFLPGSSAAFQELGAAPYSPGTTSLASSSLLESLGSLVFPGSRAQELGLTLLLGTPGWSWDAPAQYPHPPPPGDPARPGAEPWSPPGVPSCGAATAAWAVSRAPSPAPRRVTKPRAGASAALAPAPLVSLTPSLGTSLLLGLNPLGAQLSQRLCQPARSPAPEEPADPEGYESDDCTALGTLDFSLLYDQENNALHCTINKAKGLKPMDHNGLADPYVKLHLLPGASKVRNLFPSPSFPGAAASLWKSGLGEAPDPGAVGCCTQTLSVCSERCSERAGGKNWAFWRGQVAFVRTSQTAGCWIPSFPSPPAWPDRFSLIPALPCPNWRSDFAVPEPRSQQGSPPRGEGEVKAAQLIALASRIFYLKPDEDKKSKHKTAVKKKTLNPEFNEVGFLTKRCLRHLAELMLPPHLSLSLSPSQGGVVLGINAKGERLKHWFDCLKNKDKKIERWHTLTNE